MFLSKYGVARIIYIPIVKRAAVDFALGSDWTPVAGDVLISKDGGVAANVTNLPTALTMGNTVLWLFSLTAAEMQAAQVMVIVADAATKAVEDQSFIIETYGNAAGQHEIDLDQPKLDANVTHWLGTAIAAVDTAGYPKVTIKNGTGAGELAITTGHVDADVQRLNGSTATVNAMYEGNTADSGTTTTITDASLTQADTDYWKGSYVLFTNGTLLGQCRLITGFTPATDTITFAPAVTQAVSTHTYVIIPAAAVGLVAPDAINAASIAADAITDAKVAADVTIASVTGAVGSVTGNVGGNVVGSVASVTAGVTLAASAVQAIWDALTTALTTVGSIGKRLADNIDAAVSTRLATASYTAPLDAAGTRAAVGMASANLDTLIDALPTANENADALLDRTNGVETGLTLRNAMRLNTAALAGKVSGARSGSEVFRNAVADSKNRLTVTSDASGNRTAITTDLT